MIKSAVKRTTAVLLSVLLTTSLSHTVLADSSVDWSARRDRSPTASSEDSKNSTSSTAAVSNAFAPSTKYPYDSLQKKITDAQKTNKQVKGWIVVPGTNINEPIVHSSESNDYYVNRDWTGVNFPNNHWSNPANTAAYTDMYTKFGKTWKATSKNTVIYGHNWTNLRNPLAIGTNNNHKMFGQLPSYTDINFAKTNPYIYYSTDEVEGIWKVFAVAYTENVSTFPYNMASPGTKTMQSILDEWKSRTLFNFDVDVNTSDHILTLSTCTRVYANGSDNQRYVVVARLLREGESEKDAVTVTANPNIKQPKF